MDSPLSLAEARMRWCAEAKEAGEREATELAFSCFDIALLI
jgi:hypothetical protein